MIEIGDRLPEGVLRVKSDEGTPVDIPVTEYFAGRKVVLVGVPGAFTSTCHNSHIPQFVTKLDPIMERGADAIAVLSVNDHHVMRAWAESLKAQGKLDFLADPAGDFTRALGLEVDMPGLGGKRCTRFSALVEDGVVRTLNFEPEGGRGITTTGAAAMLTQL